MTQDTPLDSWADRTGKAQLTDRQFVQISVAAGELPEIMPNAFEFVKPRHAGQLTQDFLDIRGNTMSSGGLFAALGGMTKEMVTPAEEVWFKKVARFYRRVMNSVLGRELDDTSDVDIQALLSAPPAALVVLSQLSRNTRFMEEVFPSSPGKAK